MTSYFLGLNLSHDSAAAITDATGSVIAALQEERLSRRKNDYCFPAKTPAYFHKVKLLEGECLGVVVGSHNNPAQYGYEYWRQVLDPPIHPGWPPNPFELAPGLAPGVPADAVNDVREWLSRELTKKLAKYNLTAPISYVSHEDAHSALAIGGSGFESGLSVTLDGSGDNESGVIQRFSRVSGIEDLVRIPDFESFGNVYSEVTKRYSFKPVQHEGKITGLAAFGDTSEAVEYLKRHIQVIDGSPRISVNHDSLHRRMYRRVFRGPRSSDKFPRSLPEMIEFAARLTRKYPDLAYAVQRVLEQRIVEMVTYWVNKTGEKDVCLSGGVFANVKFNQLVAESPLIKRVFVAPPMGDCGLALGGIWHKLIARNKLSTAPLLEHVLLAPAPEENSPLRAQYELTPPAGSMAKAIEIVDGGGMVGVFDGPMEFGPRALGARSILMSATDAAINVTANKRLNRTEFMPFAPVVLGKYFNDLFEAEAHGSLVPFNFMTMAIGVRGKWRDRIPAAVHVDGTARPQIIDSTHTPLMAQVLTGYYQQTGIPVLINTSFNLHEEPIIFDLADAFRALDLNAVDAVLTEKGLYQKK